MRPTTVGGVGVTPVAPPPMVLRAPAEPAAGDDYPARRCGVTGVSVVLMTYAERDSIRSVIEGFFDTGVVDEVLVVNNNAQDGTVEEVEKTSAHGLRASAGRSHACRRGWWKQTAT